MAQLPPQFWMLKKTEANGTTHYKAATGTYATPKLYKSKGVAEAAGKRKGYKAVPVSINFL